MMFCSLCFALSLSLSLSFGTRLCCARVLYRRVWRGGWRGGCGSSKHLVRLVVVVAVGREQQRQSNARSHKQLSLRVCRSRCWLPGAAAAAARFRSHGLIASIDHADHEISPTPRPIYSSFTPRDPSNDRSTIMNHR
uniref:Putative secreted protein n=1 Tax=Anopheles marajoara TaxID=58244 RepID=A0A2M4C6W1_9DIPT